MSVNKFTAQMVDTVDLIKFGVCMIDFTYVTYSVSCVEVPHCQHSAVPMLAQVTGNLSSSIYKPRQINGFFSGAKTRHQHEGGRIELGHTTMAYGVRYLVQKISKGMVYCIQGLSYET